MDETYNTIGIVTNSQPWREYDSMVTAYTADYGKLELLARGTKKIKSKLAGHLEPATLANLMVVRGRKIDYVGFATGENCFINVKNDFEKLAAAGAAFGLFNKLIKAGISDERIFLLLNDFLEILDRANLPPNKVSALSRFFILKLFSQLGYAPELYFCVGCRSKILANNKTKFDFKKSGLVCPKCQNNIDKEALTISDDCIKILRIIIRHDFKKITKIKINKNLLIEVCGFIVHYEKYHTN